MKATLEHLTAAVGDLTGRTPGAPRPAGVNAWRVPDWHAALLDIPLDERAYEDRLQVPRHAEIEALWRWWPDRHAVGTLEPRAVGFLGYYLLTLVALHCSDRMRFHGDAPRHVAVAGTTAEDLSADLVADPDVRRAIVALHDPDAPPGTRRGLSLGAQTGVGASPRTRAEWAAIDVTTLEFYRHGTTSIILTGRVAAPSRGRTVEFALKCLIHPYRTIPAITAATRGYLAEHGRLDAVESSPAVRVWASHDSWILMDLIRGRTLGEQLAQRAATRPPPPARDILRPIDTEALRELGGALLTALAALEEEGRRHDDLTPSNIIVEDHREPGRFRLRFVDLGVNHLHTRSIAGQEGDGAYAAPEVRRDGVGHARADLYSLGALLIAVAGIPHNADGTVPDQFYVTSVGLARLLEDLTDADPGRRLLVTPVDPVGARFEQIGQVFRDEVAILEQDGRERPRTRLDRLKDLSPGAGTVARQRRMLQERSAQVRDGTGAAHLRRARRLRRWAWLCAVLLWCATALIVTWWSRDLGLSWQARWFEMADEVVGRSGTGLAFLDDIRADDYPVPDPWGNLPVRLVTLTFALVSARLYLNVFAELSTLWVLPRRRSARVRAVLAEVGLRSLAVLPALYVVLPTLVQRDWWPLGTLVGHVTFAVVVQACLWFAWGTNARARAAGLSSVPQGEIATLGRLAAWQPTVAVYLVPIIGIGTLLSLGLVHDELVYACFVSLINLGIFYPKSAGTDAPYIRAGMNRAALAAERLEHLGQKGS
ncbi:protein kinase domain-containing protein [Promicromonospora xylanilytica]